MSDPARSCEEPACRWNATIRRAYGTGLRQRQQLLRETGTMPIEVVPNIKSKNSTDMFLAVDVMEELYRGHTDSVTLVSGDTDFTPLVLKIREFGKPIIVFGYDTTPSVLQKACTSFHAIDCRKKRQVPQKPSSSNAGSRPKLGVDAFDRRQLRARMANTFVDLTGDLGVTTIARFSSFLRKQDPAFTPKVFGTRSLRSLLKQLGGFEILPLKDQAGKIINYEIAMVTAQALSASEQLIENNAR